MRMKSIVAAVAEDKTEPVIEDAMRQDDRSAQAVPNRLGAPMPLHPEYDAMLRQLAG